MQDWPILSLFIARTKGVLFMPSVVEGNSEEYNLKVHYFGKC